MKETVEVPQIQKVARVEYVDEVVQVLRQAMGHEVYEATRGRFVGGQ